MILRDKREFLNSSLETLDGIYEMLSKLPALSLDEMPSEKTALIIIDMINGFAREGALQSPRVEALIPAVAALSQECSKRGIAKVAFADNHTQASPEFGSYPAHCLAGTSESEIVDELKSIGGYQLIPKNSTNGFLEDDFAKWMEQNSRIRNFIVAGDCTDICIQQFAVTLKTWFNRKNELSRIIVPIDAVDTYDLGLHGADLLNASVLFSMQINGIELVSGVRFD